MACLHPTLGAVLAAADAIIPSAVGLALLAAILLGSNETCERAFRLLRWIAGHPEPPAPADLTSQSPSAAPGDAVHAGSHSGHISREPATPLATSAGTPTTSSRN